MSFKLLIECSKDIVDLHINFVDGTSSFQKSQKSESVPDVPTPVGPISGTSKSTQFLDTDTDYSSEDSEIVKKPEITREDRPIKVAPELQNLDI
jgi:hypothetical protein